MVEMLGLKKPLPTEISDSAISMIAIVSGLRSPPGSNAPLGSVLRVLAVVEQRDRAVLVAADLELLARGRRDSALRRGSLSAGRRNGRPDDFVSLAVDGRDRAWPACRRSEREIADRHDDRAELHRRAWSRGTGRRASRRSAASDRPARCSRRRGRSPAGRKTGNAWSDRASAAPACRNSRTAPTSRW